MAGRRMIKVEVVYAAGPAGPFSSRTVELAQHSTVMQAIEASGLRHVLPQGAIDDARLGIYSRRVQLSQLLADGDRVEIYRPLVIHPMEARRRRARNK